MPEKFSRLINNATEPETSVPYRDQIAFKNLLCNNNFFVRAIFSGKKLTPSGSHLYLVLSVFNVKSILRRQNLCGFSMWFAFIYAALIKGRRFY